MAKVTQDDARNADFLRGVYPDRPFTAHDARRALGLPSREVAIRYLRKLSAAGLLVECKRRRSVTFR
jgi:hypothetical protein